MKLQKWLDENGESQVSFARRCTMLAATGTTITQSMVSKWCRGIKRPGPWTRRVIAAATAGEVNDVDWGVRRRAQSRAVRRSAVEMTAAAD
jgi:hypothetical protein